MIMVAASLRCTCAFAQKSAVPAAIQSKFAKSYPAATKVKWEKEDAGYEASFKLKGMEISVLYSANGTLEETETEIKVSELPAKARTYAAAKGKIQEAAKIVLASGVVKYEAEVKDRDLLFDEKGNFLEEKTEAADEKD